MKHLWNAVRDRIWLSFLLVSLLCLIIYILNDAKFYGKVGLTIRHSWIPGALALVFAFVAIADAARIIWKRRHAVWQSGGIEVIINHPEEGDSCPIDTIFAGTLIGKPTHGSHFWLLRRFKKGGPYYVDKEITDFKEVNKSTIWSVSGHVGGAPGHPRWFEIWVTGPDSSSYFEQLQSMQEAYWNRAKHLISNAGVDKKHLEDLSSALSFTKIMSDAKLLATRRVNRK